MFSARSTRMRVKDPEALKADLAELRGGVIDVFGPDEDGYYAFGTSYAGEWLLLSGDPNDYCENLIEAVAPHLCDGAVCIIQEVGLNVNGGFADDTFAVGAAIAFDSTGDAIGVDIDDIFAKARATFDIPNDGNFNSAWDVG
jgi:hypothetical protein